MIELTIKQLEESLDQIIESYDNGGNEHYCIVWEDENKEVKRVMLIPYDGPYSATIQEDSEGNAVVELPQRIISKFDLKEGDEFDVEVEDGAVKFIPKKVKNGI